MGSRGALVVAGTEDWLEEATGLKRLRGKIFVGFKSDKSNKCSLIFQTRQPPIPAASTVNPHRMVFSGEDEDS